MRWVLVAVKSLATGVLAIVLSFVALFVALNLYGKYVLHLGANQAVGYDVGSIFGQHWRFVLLAIPVLIFMIGCIAGYWVFGKPVTSRWNAGQM